MAASLHSTTYPLDRISTGFDPESCPGSMGLRRRARVTRPRANPSELDLGFGELAERFFEAPADDETASFDAWETQGKRAMYATFAMLAVAVLLLGGFLFYARVIMPMPVELGVSAAEPRGGEH
jgi:hypothetical protein